MASAVHLPPCMETSAFAASVTRHRDDVYKLAFRLLGNRADAEDIVQETFLHAWRAISSFDRKAGIRTWLHRIAVNAAGMHWRAARRRPTGLLQDLLPDFDETAAAAMFGAEPGWIRRADDLIEQKQSVHKVQRALDAIGERYRAILALRDLQGESTEEVSRVLGISPANVRQRLLRARRALRDRLEHLERTELRKAA